VTARGRRDAKKLAELRLELVEATRLSFDECRRKNADQTIYAYALVVCSRGGEALQPWCHTEESFAKKEAKWPGRGRGRPPALLPGRVVVHRQQSGQD
jgi:hypothetical protein